MLGELDTGYSWQADWGRMQIEVRVHAQESIVNDITEGEKSANQLKGHLKDVLQACSGLGQKPSARDRREHADVSSNGLQAPRVSDGMMAGMSE